MEAEMLAQRTTFLSEAFNCKPAADLPQEALAEEHDRHEKQAHNWEQ